MAPCHISDMRSYHRVPTVIEKSGKWEKKSISVRICWFYGHLVVSYVSLVCEVPLDMSQSLMPDYLVRIERIDRDFTTKHEAAERLLTAHQITYAHEPTVDNSRSRFSMFNTYVSTSLVMFVSVRLSVYLHTVDCR